MLRLRKMVCHEPQKISAKFGSKCHKFVTFEKPGEKSPGFPRPTATYDGAGSIHLIWLRLLFIYPKPLYDTPIVKESECDNRNEKMIFPNNESSRKCHYQIEFE